MKMKRRTVAPVCENALPDGTGRGFLVWFRLQGREWTIFDTEVLWAFHG
jgi:hypothetical protein